MRSPKLGCTDHGSHHKRISSKLSLHRHHGKHDNDAASPIAGPGNDSSSLDLQPTMSTKITNQSSDHQTNASVVGAPKPVSESGRSGRAPSFAQDKPLSIEQSVRKFRTFEALRSGDTAKISRCIRETSDPANGASNLEDTTILHLAIQCGDLPVVEHVITDGASMVDINAKDKDGNTPLHIAASQGRGPVVRLLLQQPGINDSAANYQGKLPLDLAKTPDIFQMLQLSRSLFVDSKIKEIQVLIASGDYSKLGDVLEEPRVKTVLDINGGEFASEITTVQSGGTLLHEAARRKNTQLIQVLLLHGKCFPC